MNKYVKTILSVGLASVAASYAADNEYKTIVLEAAIPADTVVDMSTVMPCPTICERAKTFASEHKTALMTGGSATLALTTNVVLGQSNAIPSMIFMGLFGTSLKGMLPKSSENQVWKIGIPVAVGAAAITGDYVITNYAGLDTNHALSNLALVGGMASLKRVQKGHIKGDAKKAKKTNKAKKPETQAEAEDLV